MRVALYARVSTRNMGQDVEVQLQPLREFAAARGFVVSAEYVDVGVSGSKTRRPQLDRLMRDARTRKTDAVIVARFDRFARSTRHLVEALDEFQALGVHFISLNESIDTSTPMGRMVFTVLGAVAELERNIIVERVHAGLANARRKGVTLGRPQSIVDRHAIREASAAGESVRAIAARFGVSKSLVSNVVTAPATA